MRDDMYENLWSPFDPEWYKKAFDKHISTGDEIFNKEDITSQGYVLPDTDGSRSSVFHKDAVLNNSFNEEKLRETLNEIYSNSSNRLIASNHDNCHFFKWNGTMSDVTIIPNTEYCEIELPTDSFISQSSRDRYKLSLFFDKWISITDLLNNWDTFHWNCLLFINKKIYSEYMIYMDDHTTKIKFKYKDFWISNNYPIYIYKFDTNAQCRIKISKELMNNQWYWKVPPEAITNQRVLNSKHVMVAFNKIADTSLRSDNIRTIDPLGDNLEFLTIEDGYIDLSNISRFNKKLINSERKEYVWMSICVPKFFNEFPILLPTDIVYRPYQPKYTQLGIIHEGLSKQVKTEMSSELKNVYINMDNTYGEWEDGWKYVIRPLVLSDGYRCYDDDPYIQINEEMNHLKQLTVQGADLIEEFRMYINEGDCTVPKFEQYCDDLVNILTEIKETHDNFMIERNITTNTEYNEKFKLFTDIMPSVKAERWTANRFTTQAGSTNDFWLMVSPLIYIPQDMASLYSVSSVVSFIGKDLLWEQKEFNNTHRFSHPIDVLDFWMFEYDINDQVWRPCVLEIERHFPDVYTFKDPENEEVVPDRVFKAFFFYSDTMNINQTTDIINPTASWDNDLKEYDLKHEAIYRDIFMEKFYWMGIKAIYSGLIMTQYRWEVIEYVMDNTSYERFNQLYLNTMDPYYKLGLSTYLKSDDYEFPFDYEIHKLQERINTEYLGYKRVTNFEMYLNNTWIPSYFDYIVNVMDNHDWSNHIVYRPRASFDTRRLLPILNTMYEEMETKMNELMEHIDWILDQLSVEDHSVNVANVYKLKETLLELKNHLSEMNQFISDLDMEIFSVEDVNVIASYLSQYNSYLDEVDDYISIVYEDIYDRGNSYPAKYGAVNAIYTTIYSNMRGNILNLYHIIDELELNDFFTTIIDQGDQRAADSLIEIINRYTSPWPDAVKLYRDKLYVATNEVYAWYNSGKSFKSEELDAFLNRMLDVFELVRSLKYFVISLWDTRKERQNEAIVNKFDHIYESMESIETNIRSYIEYRNALMDNINEIGAAYTRLNNIGITKTELALIQVFNIFIKDILTNVSYINTSEHFQEALKLRMTLEDYCKDWLKFVNDEKALFDRMVMITSRPNNFIDTMRSYSPLIDVIEEYLDTVNEKYIPDDSLPTYANIYTIDRIEVLTTGCKHEVEDTVFVPDLGVYQITEVDGEVNALISMEEVNVRKTTFRDPCIQHVSYDTTTSGDGFGITVKATSSNSIKIIDDTIITEFHDRIGGILAILQRDVNGLNPYINLESNRTIEKIQNLKSDWDKTISFYREYMSDSGYQYMDNFVNLLYQIIDPVQNLVILRENNDLNKLVSLFSEFKSKVQEYFTENNRLSAEYNYYYNRLEEGYHEAQEFIGRGSSWEDESQMYEMAHKIWYVINLADRKLIVPLNNDEFTEILSSIYTITSAIEEAKDGIEEYQNNVNTSINNLNDIYENIPELQKDKWYKIHSITVAKGGTGYGIGDIIKIIPELSTDVAGNIIHTDNDEEILNDTIFFKVMRVNEDGEVVTIKPLMDYALPYSLYGARNTETKSGTGEGLVLSIVSKEISIHDNTLFFDENSDLKTPNRFNSTDLLKFNIENIHNIPSQYEVFYSGKQTQDTIIRKEQDHDVIYLNANEIDKLSESAIYTKRDQYLIYKLEDIEIVDKGAGYYKGQNIVIDAESTPIKATVSSITNDHLKGIESITLSTKNSYIERYNPNNDHSKVVTDTINNIDDEFNDGYYNQIPEEGIVKPATMLLDPEEYTFTSYRFSNVSDGMRNHNYMYFDTKMYDINGDSDYHTYLGHRFNEQHRYNGIAHTIPESDGIIPSTDVVPNNQPILGEYQFIKKAHIHNTPTNEGRIDKVVDDNTQIPKYSNEWDGVTAGMKLKVVNDSDYDNKSTIYRVRSFYVTGYIIYDSPYIIEESNNSISVSWYNDNYYPDLLTLHQLYPELDYTVKTYGDIEAQLLNPGIERKYNPKKLLGTYIDDIKLEDISVYNFTLKKWEDLNDVKWSMSKDENGFTLTYTSDEDYSYEMWLYLNKTSDTQTKNALLKKDAVFSVKAIVADEVVIPTSNISVNLGRDLRIRKLYPYIQKETFTISKSLGYEMDFKLANYIYYKNEIHLEDISIYNKSAGRFEDITDQTMFEVRFKNDKYNQRGYETHTKIIQSVVVTSGEGFVNGTVWGYNEAYGIHIFGTVTTDFMNDGHILTFEPLHCPNPPEESMMLEFRLFQNPISRETQEGVAIIEFKTERVEIWGDGYIHNVVNPLAPVPDEFKVICLYDTTEPIEYEIIINKMPKIWSFVDDKWIIFPQYMLEGVHIPQDRIYINTEKGRFPLVNPSTGKPSIYVEYDDNNTIVTFLNMYHKYEHLEVHTTPYPMKSVYIQRRVPKNGYIDLKGQINKPLNKKYFEFWMNGRLLNDEVTIISPSKLFLHGLKSLRNFEIIEINRDFNEYFADSFLTVEENKYGRPYPRWIYDTYLDGALEGTLSGDNYTTAEQEYLLSPVWKQVERDHPEFKNYPPNSDTESDILLRVDDVSELGSIETTPLYQFTVIDTPSIEGVPVIGRSMTFDQFGFLPISDNMIIEMLNEEWADEIVNGEVPAHMILSDDEWYGYIVRMYNEYGELVDILDEAAYYIIDNNIIRINTKKHISRILKSTISYDLT